MTPNEYRQKHKRCVTCEYYGQVSCFCKVKQIMMISERERKKNQRFCKVYKAKEY